jgi:hypothetical protein
VVECFKPFLRELLALSLSRRTLRLHRDNIWVLGGEVIRRLQMDSSLRRQPIQQVVRAHGSCRRRQSKAVTSLLSRTQSLATVPTSGNRTIRLFGCRVDHFTR